LRFLRAELPGILATRTDVLSPRMGRTIEDVVEFLNHLFNKQPERSQPEREDNSRPPQRQIDAALGAAMILTDPMSTIQRDVLRQRSSGGRDDTLAE
jgi:hypothetical protein